jgi:hypothetical protein
LIEDSDRAEIVRGDSDHLLSGSSYAPVESDLGEFDYLGFAGDGIGHKVDPFQRGASVRSWVANPIPFLGVAGVVVWAPRNAGLDDVQATLVGCLVAHSESREAVPFFGLWVLEVFDP